jgi:predicted dehydrogenase
MIKEAFQEGKHIFCEKPVGSSIEDAREISKLDKSFSNLKLGFNYQYRYDYNCFNLAKGAQNDHLGTIYYAICNGNFGRDEGYLNQGPWRTKLETAGGGTLLIQGSHIIDIMIWALGEPISVIGKVDNLKFKDIEVEDIGFGIIEFENGSYGQVSNSMITRPHKRRNIDKVILDVFGEKGNCYYEGPWPLSSIKWERVKEYKIKEYVDRVSPYTEAFKAFINWLLNDEPFLNTIEQSSKVLRLLKALYKSSETGKKEKVEKL